MAEAAFKVKNSLVVGGVVSNSSGALISPVATTLADGGTIAWDFSVGNIATVTLGGNRTVLNPTNLAVGTYLLKAIQDGTGGRDITWGSAFKWTAGIKPTLTSTAGAVDLFSFFCDGTNLYGSFIPDVR